ncbi:hypothetical protein Pcinc_025823 [Petrolisthes cinctipes]|uniref:Uncharacterized protein n=1 Tax=Petrolisthes cinctipes TaxID=88211 RepID=A0AAE1F758_PETCI|nr:hypothetical protein Pcinc_025823 [Petrolisthes cinctipes]
MLVQPPSTGIYEALKTSLVQALGKSKQAYLLELDSLQSRGRRPSSLLIHMQGLAAAAGISLSDPKLRIQFLQLLPREFRVHYSCLPLSKS